jgi:alpha-methylacyl-CoA racemase
MEDALGPLKAVKVIELAGVGPGPMCAMLLADLGAEVLRIENPTPAELGVKRPRRFNLTLRGRKTIALDLKSPEGKETALKLIARSDVLIEGFRPGVTERLGLGPADCFHHNQMLIYGRITGWGQSGPLANAAGHDLNYIALTGALHAIGRHGQPPSPPLNLVGDFGGGALYLAIGILSALVERQQAGRGQIVDAAIVDGAASLMTQFYGMAAAGLWSDERGTNVIDSGAPFYDVYECADGRFASVAPLEHKFLVELVLRLKLPQTASYLARDVRNWPQLRLLLSEKFKSMPLHHWCAVLEGTDSCFGPVLTIDEAPNHPHLKQRQTFVEIDGIVQPAPAPRFSRSIPETPVPPQTPDTRQTREILAEWLSH